MDIYEEVTNYRLREINGILDQLIGFLMGVWVWVYYFGYLKIHLVSEHVHKR